MNRLVLVGFALILATTSGAASRKGGYDFEIKGSYVFNNERTAATATTESTTEGQLGVSSRMGRYFTDKFLAGIIFPSFQSQTWGSYWGYQGVFGIGVFGEYDLVASDTVVPFLGLSLEFLSNDNVVVTQVQPSAGLKIFFTDTVAISCSAILSIGGGEIYDYTRVDETSGEGKRTAFSSSAGIHFLFF